MRFVQTSSSRIAVDVTGEGEPLLFIHGFPLDHRMWQAQTVHFSRKYQVLAPDLPGYGLSSPLEGPYTLHDTAAGLIEVLEKLAPGKRVTVFGLSMGGYIAWQLVHRWPERIARLVICHSRSAADTPETARGRRIAIEGIRQSGPAAFLAAMLGRLLAPQTQAAQPAVVSAVQGWMQQASPESLTWTLDAIAGRPDSTPWLAAIQCPTLILAGSEDPITPAAEMRELAGQIRSSRFVELPDAGHLSPCECPARFNSLLEDFLSATSP